MKTFFILLISIMIFSVSCLTNSNNECNNVESYASNQADKNSLINNDLFLKVHSLKKNDNSFIGNVNVNFINDSVFTELYVTNKSDTLYSIEKNILSNVNHTEIEVDNYKFYGYKFILKKDDYFVLSYLSNRGKNVSDDITIEWNYDENILELQKIP